jgi:hypothetical protein
LQATATADIIIQDRIALHGSTWQTLRGRA